MSFTFGVTPPWNRDNPVEHMAFNLWAMEQEEEKEKRSVNMFSPYGFFDAEYDNEEDDESDEDRLW